MRYYTIEITGGTSALYSSLGAQGRFDPGALNVEFDIAAYNFAAPVSYGHVRVWGVSLKTITQASDFNGATVKVYAGMSTGLPLANPAQNGLILQGRVFQAYGNWVGVDMTLDLVIQTDGGATQSAPANIVVDWKKGDTMASALATTLATAYPDLTTSINISDKLVLAADEAAHYQTIEQLAAYVNDTSRSIIDDPSYTGVQITIIGTVITVFDGTVKTDPKPIAFQDMIGQPTWIGFYQVQVTLVMRADIQCGDFLKFPDAVQTRTGASDANVEKDRPSFTGSDFQVQSLRHVGNFRAPDAGSWVTVIEAFAAPKTDLGASAQADALG